MDAIPCAIYTAPMSIFRCDVVTHISTDEQPCCYIQILERISYLSYAVRVASSCDDLIALHRGEATESVERRVLVTTISRQDLHQRCSLVLAPQAAQPLYAAPAAILADKDLLIASAAWLTYFKVLDRHPDGFVEVRVAALPHRVETDSASFTTLTREEFAQALAIGRRELSLATCDLLEMVESHAQAVIGRPVEHLAPVVDRDEEDKRDAQSTPARSYPPEVLAMLRTQEQPRPATPHRQAWRDISLPPSALIDLEEAIFVEDADLPSGLAPVINSQMLDAALKDYGARSDASALLCALRHYMRTRTSSFHVQQCFLQAALDTVMRHLYGCADTTRVEQLTARCLRIALLKRWHRGSRQRVIDAVPIYNVYERCTEWRLTLSFPTSSSARREQVAC